MKMHASLEKRKINGCALSTKCSLRSLSIVSFGLGSFVQNSLSIVMDPFQLWKISYSDLLWLFTFHSVPAFGCPGQGLELSAENFQDVMVACDPGHRATVHGSRGPCPRVTLLISWCEKNWEKQHKATFHFFCWGTNQYLQNGKSLRSSNFSWYWYCHCEGFDGTDL